MTPPRVIVIADDLTGAVEAAGALADLSRSPSRLSGVDERSDDHTRLRRETGNTVHLAESIEGVDERSEEQSHPARADVVLDLADLVPEPSQPSIIAVDLNCRMLPADEALTRLRTALVAARHWAGPLGRVVKKIDSLWRGNTAAEVRVLAATSPAVLVPTLPGLGRIVRDGALHGVFDGAPDPYGQMDLRGLLGPGTHSISLRVTRSGADALSAAIAAAIDRGDLPLVDAETAEDLDVVAAALDERPDWLIIGTGGIAAALGRRSARSNEQTSTPTSGRTTAQVAVLVGSTEPVVRDQIRRLSETGCPVIEIADPSTSIGETLQTSSISRLDQVDPLSSELGAPIEPVVVFTSPPATSRADDGGRWAQAVVHNALSWCRDADCVATGGATARALLDTLGVTRIQLLAEVHPGAIITRTPTGRLVATRPGSFGGPDSLAALVEGIQAIRLSAKPGAGSSVPDRKAD